MGQLPVLKVDGVVYAQSQAIVTYAAKVSGLPKLTPIEELRSDMIIETIKEIIDDVVKPAGMAMGNASKSSNLNIFNI